MFNAVRHLSMPIAAVAIALLVNACTQSPGGGTTTDEAALQVTEFLASNSAVLADEDGDFSDWIEIHNPSGKSASLTGWYLTDDAEEPDKWAFPSVTLAAGEYLVVFASGKDRSVAGSELHTSFKLGADGGSLVLVSPGDASGAREFGREYPKQYSDISYGLDGDLSRYFLTPTPGRANGDGVDTVDVEEPVEEETDVSDPQFSSEHGFYDAALSLSIETSSSGATIRYTVDGSAPSETTGTLYTEPVDIGTTTCVRAIAYADGKTTSDVITQTYIFLDDVLRQPANPTGFPTTWGLDNFAEPPAYTAADYAMDPTIVAAAPLTDDDGDYDLKDALLSIPTMSLVMKPDDLFNQSSDPTVGGIYANPEQEGVDWERAASVELINPDGSDGFQTDCAVRIYGGMGRSPWAKKHTFRLLFKAGYGPTKLKYPMFGDDAAEEFDSIIVRANFNDSWTMSWDDWKLDRVQLIRDEWMRSSQLAMGWVGSHGTFVHLYVNGLYWGLYNPVERPDASFASSYSGGTKDNWDALHDGDPIDGDSEAWARATEAATAGLGTTDAYQRLQGNNADGTPNTAYENLLDVTNMADYMLLNFHAGTEDWDVHNWYAGRNRDGSGGYLMYVWDGEIAMLSLEGNDLTTMNTPGCPSELFQALALNSEFRMLLADRVQYHFFNDGSLTPEKAGGRYEALADLVGRAVVAESARWGDTVRSPAYTRDVEWATERDWLLNEYFPQRTATVLQFLISAGLYPSINAPAFAVNGTAQHGGAIESGDQLSMTSDSGTIWYTLDGTDPRKASSSSGTPPTSESETLIASGSTWSYLDDGTDPGTAWQTGDVTWSTGAAQFGYGDGDESTVVNCGASSPTCDTGNFTTTYFRHTFNVADVSAHTSMTLRLLRDDGAVVYLNGTEAARSNMDPEAAIGSNTFALEMTEDESLWVEYQLDPSALLVTGDNVIAVEIHQSSAVSSDISFDLELVTSSTGIAPAATTAETSTTAIEYDGAVTLSATVQVKARVLADGEWSALSNATFAVVRAPALIINEFMADNTSTIEDPDDDAGTYEDWIEIYNPGSSDVDMGGLYLTDDLTNPTKWQVPQGVTITAGGYLLLWADGDTTQGDTHADFKLNVAGEALGLYGSDGVTLIDSITFDAQTADVSYGRLLDGGENTGVIAAPTPGATNGT